MAAALEIDARVGMVGFDDATRNRQPQPRAAAFEFIFITSS
jgi:hypothetical protein